MKNLPVCAKRLAVFAFTAFVFASILCLSAAALTAREVSDKCSSAVFYIEVYSDEGTSQGSGFFIHANGTAVTNYHVVEGGKSAAILTTDGETYTVDKILYYSKEDDIAIVRPSRTSQSGRFMAGFPYLKMLSQSSAANGDIVYAIGSPRGYSNTISDGIISNSNRIENGVPMIQFTAPVSPGSSGGALLNENGDVIGIPTQLRTDAQNINFAAVLDTILYFNCLSEGVPFSELTSYASPILEPFEAVYYESDYINGDYQTTIIENGDTINGNFGFYSNTDIYSFTVPYWCNVEFTIFAGVFENSYEKEHLSTLAAGLIDVKTNDIIYFFDSTATSNGLMMYSFSGNLSAGEYEVMLMPSETSRRSWQGENYCVYLRYGDNSSGEQIPSLPFTNIPGSVVGSVLYTDIVAKINGYTIRSYNINGNTAIVAEDLMKYGFKEYYNNTARNLVIFADVSSEFFTPPQSVASTVGFGKVGEKAFDVVSTDIATFFGYDKIDSFSINGEMLIYIDDIASVGTLVWDQYSRTISLNIPGLPTK